MASSGKALPIHNNFPQAIFTPSTSHRLENDLGDGLLAFCNLVILAGLNAPLTQTELGLLLEYVENGGSVLVLAESTNSPQLYNAFTRHFGITVVKGMCV